MSKKEKGLEKLDSIEVIGEFEFDGTEESVELAGERIVFLYVDYGLLRKEGRDKFWGNWSKLTSEACSDQRVYSYVDRKNMRDIDFVMRCEHHSKNDGGIWKFSIALGGK